MKKNKTNRPDDIKDSAEDKKQLRGDQGTLDLPDVNDIPGQKNNSQSATTASSDTSISSSDEEGYDVLDENENIVTDKKTNVSSIERKMLDDAFDPVSSEDEPIDELTLDNKDNEGDALNEKSMDKHLFGDDLDTDLEEEEDEE